MAIINKEIPGFGDMEMVILKTYIYRKHYGYQDNRTGIMHEGDKYLTLFTMVPFVELRDFVEVKAGIPNSIGVFVKVVGSHEGLITTPYRVSLMDYQNHLELNGWEFIQTVRGAKGGEYERIRKQAFSIIKGLEKAHEEVERINMKKEAINELIRLIREESGPKTTILSYLKQIEDIVNN